MLRIRAALFLLLISACSSDPQAPVLHDTPVFHSEADGFRFVVPDEFKLLSRANLPSGKIDRDVVIAQYQRFGTGKAATFEVSRHDDWSSEKLDTILQSPSHGVKNWSPSGKAESIDLQGTPAERRVLEGTLGREKMRKEVVAFRRGERGYFFVMQSKVTDDSARNQLRRILEGLTWLN